MTGNPTRYPYATPGEVRRGALAVPHARTRLLSRVAADLDTADDCTRLIERLCIGNEAREGIAAVLDRRPAPRVIRP